ncbi:hypothetical protein VP01_1771g2 [Puccinia sorghi]|uniref:Uncharacterized protein n=1 Tax=Puccinia sorghi TaxID=27349 RepID=A0A0L6VGL2_9BASI|nr:hypothetical protein VP01_1771g2 [Puccinia sorghi]
MIQKKGKGSGISRKEKKFQKKINACLFPLLIYNAQSCASLIDSICLTCLYALPHVENIVVLNLFWSSTSSNKIIKSLISLKSQKLSFKEKCIVKIINCSILLAGQGIGLKKRLGQHGVIKNKLPNMQSGTKVVEIIKWHWIWLMSKIFWEKKNSKSKFSLVGPSWPDGKKENYWVKFKNDRFLKSETLCEWENVKGCYICMQYPQGRTLDDQLHILGFTLTDLCSLLIFPEIIKTFSLINYSACDLLIVLITIICNGPVSDFPNHTNKTCPHLVRNPIELGLVGGIEFQNMNVFFSLKKKGGAKNTYQRPRSSCICSDYNSPLIIKFQNHLIDSSNLYFPAKFLFYKYSCWQSVAVLNVYVAGELGGKVFLYDQKIKTDNVCKSRGASVYSRMQCGGNLCRFPFCKHMTNAITCSFVDVTTVKSNVSIKVTYNHCLPFWGEMGRGDQRQVKLQHAATMKGGSSSRFLTINCPITQRKSGGSGVASVLLVIVAQCSQLTTHPDRFSKMKYKSTPDRRLMRTKDYEKQMYKRSITFRGGGWLSVIIVTKELKWNRRGRREWQARNQKKTCLVLKRTLSFGRKRRNPLSKKDTTLLIRCGWFATIIVVKKKTIEDKKDRNGGIDKKNNGLNQMKKIRAGCESSIFNRKESTGLECVIRNSQLLETEKGFKLGRSR